ncbi:hypothetical protein SDC9_126358 [bioreactor metagenome]|uniref:O-antigen ligase-related domain-containing protein n=1 Tax=bioreactor metagenome TaxID=1076179 RepID=A0A645CQZ6_9ZZZZ
MAGNWNWNWTLLAISAPSLAFLFPPRFRLAAAVILAAGFIGGQFLVSPGHASRGTLLSGVVAAILLFVASRLRGRPGKRKWIPVAGAVVVLAAAIVGCVVLRSGVPASAVAQENRLALWQGTIALGEKQWLFGSGPERFEGEIAPYLPLAYHDSDFAADRHPHPHNELLFYWCGFGIFGILWWGIGAALGMRGILRRRRGDGLILLTAWAWLVLLVHGQVDVILYTPLAGGLFLLLTGALAAVGTGRNRIPAPSPRLLPLLLFGGAAAVLLGVNLLSGWNCRTGKLALLEGDPETARRHLERSAAILPTPENLYALGTVELFDFRDPVAAAKTLGRIESECRLPSYSHSAGRIARALAAAGMAKESLPYFEQEQRNFPRSAVNLRLWESVARALGDTARADRLLAEWKALLAHKGIDETLFPQLLRNQHLDDSPLALKLFLKENGR